MNPPNGWFVNGILFFGRSLSRSTLLAKGFYLEVPDLRGASVSFLNEFHATLASFLCTVGDEWAMQVQWSVDSDYTDLLDHYDRITESRAEHPWTYYNRKERYFRYAKAAEQGQLRRERLVIFFTKTCPSIPKKKVITAMEQIEAFIAQETVSLERKVAGVRAALPFATIRPMDDDDHYLFYRRFLNPSLREHVNQDADLTGFNPHESILEQTFLSDGVSVNVDGGVGFVMDGLIHAMLVIRTWPQRTQPGIMTRLTSALPLNYCITQNIYPIDATKEIEREEKARRQLEGDARENRKSSLDTAIEAKHIKIRALSDGATVPFECLTVLRLWADSQKEIATNLMTLKSAISAMPGCRYHQVNHPGQIKRLFMNTFPGYTGWQHTRYWHTYAENHYLADLMPMSSTFMGDIETGEAIYDGNSANIVGLRTFAGNTPQHGVMMGMTGAGKSANMMDILTQTECFYDYTAIVEEGFSYGLYTKTMGCEPILIHPTSDLTINYLDTLGMPLSANQFSTAAGLCLKMIGVSRDEDTNNQRSAMIGEYVNQLYWDTFEDWRGINPDLAHRIAREAYAIERLRSTMSAGTSFLDAYKEFEARRASDPERFEEDMAHLDEGEVALFSKSPQSGFLVRDLAYAYFKPEEFPTHTGLVEMLKFSRMDHHEKEKTDYIATMLSAWQRDGGSNGSLFDGTSNVKLIDKVTHFELGYIPESAQALKEAAGFLITQFVRQHIVGLPRGQRKRVVFEEMSRFLNVPGGEKIVSESYAQLRKYGTWVVSVFQQYNQLKGLPIAPVVFGNSKLFLLMRQQSRDDVRDIADAVGLPSTAQDIIMEYPLPEKQEGRKFSSFSIFIPDGEASTCGTARNFVSREMLWVASSDGESFESKQRLLDNHDRPFEGVLDAVREESGQPSSTREQTA
jgi:hypothetical protein